MEVSSDLHDPRKIAFHQEIKSPIRLFTFSCSQLSVEREKSVGLGEKYLGWGWLSRVGVGMALQGLCGAWHSDLYGVPLRIYGNKSSWRSCSKKRHPLKRVIEPLRMENTSRISSKIYPLWPNLPVKDVPKCHTAWHHAMVCPSSSSTGALRLPLGNQRRLCHFLGIGCCLCEAKRDEPSQSTQPLLGKES